jgi:hypothetical protein
MITHTRRTALAALAILSLATIASAPHASAATPNSHVSTRERYTLPAAVAGCRPTVLDTKHYGDGSTSVRFSCRPAGHPGTLLIYMVNVGNPSPEAARETSELYRKGFTKPMFTGGDVHTVSATGHVWGVIELSSDQNRFTLGGPLHRVAFVVAVFCDNQDDMLWATGKASKVSLAIIARIP